MQRLPPPEHTPSVQPVQPAQSESLRYAWYVVAVLTVVNISSNIDRVIVNLLVEPMKRDLHLSDTQMSLLMGLSFALFYATLGLPMGRLADRINRRNMIIVGVAVWSAMTTFSGMVRSYWHLFAARMGVGVGEATLLPAAYSMIADYFPKHRLAMAMSVYAIAIYIGAGLAVAIGGVVVQLTSIPGTWILPIVGEIYPWQTVFFLIGLPGLLLVLLMRTVKEPVRRDVLLTLHTKRAAQADERSAEPSLQAELKELFAYVRDHKSTFLTLCLGYSTFALFSYSASAWIPSLFIRNYGWQAGTFGVIYGTMIMTFGTIGSLLGGKLADTWAARGITNAKLRVGILAASAMIPLVVAYPLMPSPELCLLVLLPINVFAGMPYGPAAAALQEVLPNQLRGLGSAVYAFLLSVIGGAFGPTLVAVLNDYVFHSPLAVRYSLAIVNSLSLAVAALVLTFALKPFSATVEDLEQTLQRQS